ncbi:differentially expressed in FDCP 8 homolog isoform X1 [Cimex lectularius]|uniref:Phorbol-ester/DAG-type domain-containing protein n=1 Tax=Cimex lectularius TaxID=79782 RepID=A0A8I6R8J7_CIMLE|nr:differentially expressed in FDCP 8 homolog isoform X1 [Cimex lectularius]
MDNVTFTVDDLVSTIQEFLTAGSVFSSYIDVNNDIKIREGCQFAFTTEELTEALERCKTLVMTSEECSDERKWLVRRLVELRHRLAQAKENELIKNQPEQEEVQVRLGHNFVVNYQPASATSLYCDHCCGTIWNVVSYYYRCIDCSYRIHIKCLHFITRVCPILIISEQGSYETKICPEVGLDRQDYKCFECENPINFVQRGNNEARKCDYSGRYFCKSCHWNSLSVIPARIMHNWDFEPKPVSQAAYQLIKMTKERPLIILDNSLYPLIEELNKIKKMREQLGHMKLYISTCRSSLESGFHKRELEWRRHLVHNTDIFSLDDLNDLHNGQLRMKIESIHSKLKKHIKEDCEVCKGRGFFCEYCKSTEVIFPFDNSVYICPKCEYVQHKHCWMTRNACPKCVRKESKTDKADE